ncbi:MAG: PDZ domain-containing protein, partial [Planctomycetota bacterium]
MVANKKRLLRVEFEGSGEQTQAEHPITIWIHHTAPIYGGNSGGPLVNLDGEQIGVNTRALFGTSQSFAVAIDVVKDVVSRILKYGRPMWAYYGWKLTELNDELKEFLKLPENFEGVFISDVVYGSPAYNAGIRGEDFLLSVDGIRVSATIKEEIPPILRMLAKKEINKPVEVVIRKKDGQILHTKVIPEDYELWEIPLMAELPGFQREKDFYASEIYGFSVQKITKKVAVKERLEVPWGVFCTGVQTGSIAANSGLSAQDIIKYIDNQPITDFDTFKKIIEQYEKNRPEKITLTVQRGNSKTYVIFRDVEKLLKSKEEKR